MSGIGHPTVCSYNRVWDVGTLSWVVMTQPGGSTGGGGDASAANQTTEIARLTSLLTELQGKADLTETQPVSLASVPSHAVTGPLTDTQLRASAVPISLATAPTTPVTGTFWQTTQPVSLAVAPTTPVTGTFWQTTQPVSGPLTDTQLRASAVPVSIASMPSTPVTGPLTDTQLRATAVPISLATAPTTPVTGTFWQATQPVSATQLPAALAASGGMKVEGVVGGVAQPVSLASLPALAAGSAVIGHVIADTGSTTVVTGTVSIRALTAADVVTVTPPALTKGTQGSTGFSTQDLKDSGRVAIAWTAEFSAAATSEALLSLTESRDGAAVTTFTSKVITSGKRLRLTAVSLQVENTLGTSIQRCYLKMRVNTAGAVTTASPLQGTWAVQALGTVKSISPQLLHEFNDGFEILGDGTKQIGFTATAPDWVTAAATSKIYLTIYGFEY